MKFPFTRKVRRVGYAAGLPGFLDYPTYVAKASRRFISEGEAHSLAGSAFRSSAWMGAGPNDNAL